jgi:hypothetical protein
MWVQTGGPPDKPVVLFDYSTSRAQDVTFRLLAGYRGYLMTDDYAGYNAVAAQDGIERLAFRCTSASQPAGLQQLKAWLDKTQPQGAGQTAPGKAVKLFG